MCLSPGNGMTIAIGKYRIVLPVLKIRDGIGDFQHMSEKAGLDTVL